MGAELGGVGMLMFVCACVVPAWLGWGLARGMFCSSGERCEDWVEDVWSVMGWVCVAWTL